MPIPVTCGCGRSLRIKDELAGRKVRCPACGAVVPVPCPGPDAEDEALNMLLADDPPASPPPPPRLPADAVTRAEGPERRPAPGPPPGGFPPPARKPVEVPRHRPTRGERDSERRGAPVAVNGEIVTGLLMMAGAAAWFFIGWSLGIIYFYPPILFVLGIGTVIRGFSARG